MKKINIPENINALFGENFKENTQNLIQQYRENQDLNIFKNFQFEKVYDIDLEKDTDKNFWERQILTLLLSDDFRPADKPLIKWLIQEFLKNIEADFWVDLRSVMALLGFMLYKNMENEDLPTLCDTKFSACSDSLYSVDLEVVLGFSMEETLAYLKAHKHQKMLKTIQQYQKNPNLKVRTYTEYIAFFEEYRFTMRQEEIATDCGLIEE